MITIAQVRTPAQVDAIGALFREYLDWAFALTPDSAVAPAFEGLDRELATLPGVYAPPAGRLLLATDDDQPAGCVALKPVDATTGELKRLYVRPTARGQRLGERLVAAVIAAARTIGYQRLVLDSHHTMKAAHRLYESAGFRYVDEPADFPVALKGIAVFMEMDLSERG